MVKVCLLIFKLKREEFYAISVLPWAPLKPRTVDTVNKWTPRFLNLQSERRFYCLLLCANLIVFRLRRKYPSKFLAFLIQPQPTEHTSVETCIAMCGLQNQSDAIISTLGVEHRKRLTIAVELAAKVFSLSASRLELTTSFVAQAVTVLG
jgi:hypothetical protein